MSRVRILLLRTATDVQYLEFLQILKAMIYVVLTNTVLIDRQATQGPSRSPLCGHHSG